MKKHYFNKNYGITNTENKKEFRFFCSQYYHKNIKLYESLFGYIIPSKEEKYMCKLITDIINRLLNKSNKKYTINELNYIIIDDVQYNNAIDNIIEKSLYFKNENNNRKYFFKNGNKTVKRTRKYYINTTQTLLLTCFINLKRGNRIRKNNKRVYQYNLYIDELIKNIIAYKYGEVDEINYFKNLFR